MMTNKILELKNTLSILKGKREQIIEDISAKEEKWKTDKRQLRYLEQAKEIIRAVGMKTQEQLQYHVSDITSLALNAVFDNPYSLELEFVQRRNKTEADLYFIRDGNKINPLSASGGGAVDVAAFALRIASWSLKIPRTRPTIILDEPMRFVSEDLKDKASEMIKEVSERLGIQFIIVTHEPKLAAYADRIFGVINRKGISKIKVEI